MTEPRHILNIRSGGNITCIDIECRIGSIKLFSAIDTYIYIESTGKEYKDLSITIYHHNCENCGQLFLIENEKYLIETIYRMSGIEGLKELMKLRGIQ